MTTDLAFLLGVPVFVLLSCVQHRLQGLVFSLVMAATTWLAHEAVGGMSMMDMSDASFEMDFRTIAHASAIGGAVVAAMYHLTRLLWQAQGKRQVNVARFVLFLLISVISGAAFLAVWDQSIRAA